MKFFETKYLFYLCCIVFRVSLDVGYVHFTNPVFAYAGYIINFSVSIYILSWVAYFICVLSANKVVGKVSDYFNSIFLFSVVAPLSSFVGFTSLGIYPLLVTTLVFLFFRLFQYGGIPSRLFPIPKVYMVAEGRSIIITSSVVAISVLLAWYFLSGAVKYLNFNILDVYKYRNESAELAAVGFFGYLDDWVYKVFSIFLMSVSLLKRRYWCFLVLLVLQVFFFGVSNHKAVLFYPLLVLVTWIYFRKARAISVVPLAMSLVIFSSLLLYTVFDQVIPGSLFIRRVFFVPAKLTIDYFSFFSTNDFVWWSNSILEGTLSYPYEQPVPKEIGKYNGSGSSANNGFISSGYGQAGLWGVLIYSLILAYFLKFLDSIVLNSDIPVWLALCITVVPLYTTLTSSDLFTTMFTHGLALCFVIVLLFRSPRRPKINHGYQNV